MPVMIQFEIKLLLDYSRDIVYNIEIIFPLLYFN